MFCRFAPIFKELGQVVDGKFEKKLCCNTINKLSFHNVGWKSMIRLAAIDCAQDENVPTCRNYEIMGYPSLKFFPPNASKSEQGELRESMSKEIPLMMSDMANYVENLSKNASLRNFWNSHEWPKIEPLNSETSMAEVKKEAGYKEIIVIAEKDISPMAIFTIMELHSIAPNKFYVRRGSSQKSPLVKILPDAKSFTVLSVMNENHPQIIYEADETKIETWQELRSILHEYVKGSHTGVGDRSQTKNEASKSLSPDRAAIKEEDIKRRRYTAFMSDLENAILYSLTHEIGSRNSIVGTSLDALQGYLDVLVKHFPGREATMNTISKLRSWVATHTDVIHGQDLISEYNDIRAETGSFADTPNGAWVGCKGSKDVYGGYPCSLWSLWHVLTVNQQYEEKPPSLVLDAMLGYIKNFFGCDDCVRHFVEAVEDGEAIKREVKDKNTSILFLWRIHNRVNVRLKGDITDDLKFPKEVWPNKQHCTDCYNNRLTTDLWSEFNHHKVLNFLNDIYSNLNYQGLLYSRRHQNLAETHELALVADEGEPRHKEYLPSSSTFWSPIDVSLCFSIYILSAAILIFVYLKFVAKKKLCIGLLYNLMTTSKPSSRNILNSV